MSCAHARGRGRHPAATKKEPQDVYVALLVIESITSQTPPYK